MDYTETRKCHKCGQRSWIVANNKPCPWCGATTRKWDEGAMRWITWLSIVAMAIGIWAMVR